MDPIIRKHNFGLIIVGFNITIAVYLFFPGFMSQDSISQYEQSLYMSFNNWHPISMSLLWAFLNKINSGTSLMLLIQIIMLNVALFLWIKNNYSGKFSYLIYLVAYLPWIMNFEGVIWKDVQFAYTALLFIIYADLYRKHHKIMHLVLMCLTLFYALNLRYNAIFAIIPIMIFFYVFVSKMKFELLVRSQIIILILAFVSPYAINSVFSAKIGNPVAYFFYDDLTYISIKNNQSFVPNHNLESVKNCAQFEIGQQKLVGKITCYAQKENLSEFEISNKIVNVAAIDKIITHLDDYFEYRLKTYRYFIRYGDYEPYYIWHPGILPNDFGLVYINNEIRDNFRKYIQRSAELSPYLFKPWIWQLIGLLLISWFLYFSKPQYKIFNFMIIAGVVYNFSYFFFTPLADFRYVYFQVLTSSIIIATLFANRLNSFFGKYDD
jgi:hypothetical protein